MVSWLYYFGPEARQNIMVAGEHVEKTAQLLMTKKQIKTNSL
jgi:hypothetical protein